MTEYPRHWTCEITVLRLESYLLRTLPFAEALAVAAHVEACPSCFQRLTLQVEQRRASAGTEHSSGETRG